ncbi:HNH endonuclease family protein [Agromyces sp. LHK192]|uniref:HNH endonuclease family protein n=1 Tax=Agromyces sp. LHK192 TaxID=2498704 RepID=UPI000FDAB749|nr:HNH endonuclease family protein [Agromyces sp. LHK192]
MTRTPRTRVRRRTLAFGTAVPAALLMICWVLLGDPLDAMSRAATDAAERTSPPAAGASADVSLVDVVVADAASTSDYERDAFGDAWADVDRNGCDTRNDFLGRDLVDAVHRNGSACVISRGTLHDPYTGTSIRFVRGERSDRVQIDHVVALSYAWRHGASEWTDDQRRAFANDPANLLAVDGRTNQQKSDLGPAEWSPPSAAQVCAYHAGFLAVLAKYDLTIAPADAAAVEAAGCMAG